MGLTSGQHVRRHLSENKPPRLEGPCSFRTDRLRVALMRSCVQPPVPFIPNAAPRAAPFIVFAR